VVNTVLTTSPARVAQASGNPPGPAPPRIMALSASAEFSGPIPHPALLAGYEKALPGAADRILGMAERQAAHRQELERDVVHANIASEKRGAYCGLTVALTGFVLAGFLGYSGQGVAAITAALAPVVGLTTAFIIGQNKKKAELAEKREAVEAPPQKPQIAAKNGRGGKKKSGN
jgi:uncharacterized membrane protein